MRMKLPGTSPPKVQNRYSTPSDSLRTTSRTSSLIITFVECVRLIGGGTCGACVSTATSSPTIVGSAGFVPLALTSASAAMPVEAAIRSEQTIATFESALVLQIMEKSSVAFGFSTHHSLAEDHQ